MRRPSRRGVLLPLAAAAQAQRAPDGHRDRPLRARRDGCDARALGPAGPDDALVDVRAGQTVTARVENGDGGHAMLQAYAPSRAITARNAASSSDGARHGLAYWTGRRSPSGRDQVAV